MALRTVSDGLSWLWAPYGAVWPVLGWIGRGYIIPCAPGFLLFTRTHTSPVQYILACLPAQPNTADSRLQVASTRSTRTMETPSCWFGCLECYPGWSSAEECSLEWSSVEECECPPAVVAGIPHRIPLVAAVVTGIPVAGWVLTDCLDADTPPTSAGSSPVVTSSAKFPTPSSSDRECPPIPTCPPPIAAAAAVVHQTQQAG
ncbi:hypothetical protein BT67DRAFT_4682 [Trichocladium antarcticum]|uniref:Uncharacterized protein n=1 Tax=Trichocladium antarcticum TaxID=1450529 RepID=A0AAN6ZHZ5_9PEZI|nr:hypothetical protein BT67DRAFT_4682 [Trichocladium antarcticum]